MRNPYYTRITGYSMIILILYSCDEFVRIDPPRTDLVRSTVFESNETAEAAMMDVYYRLRIDGFASGNPNSIAFIGALTADETLSYRTSSVADYQQINNNELDANNGRIDALWKDLYTTIYKVNAIIEGVSTPLP